MSWVWWYAGSGKSGVCEDAFYRVLGKFELQGHSLAESGEPHKEATVISNPFYIRKMDLRKETAKELAELLSANPLLQAVEKD